MTARERLNDRPVPLHLSRRRAPARTARLRSNSETSPQDKPPKTRIMPVSHSADDVRVAATVTVYPIGSQTRHHAPIEIP